MKAKITLTFWLIGLAHAPAPGQTTGEVAAASGFRHLWTGWSRVNREAMATEGAAVRRLRDEFEGADAARLRELGTRGRALGERVGEIVRLGDCEDGERIARQAGDFALVEAVRSHCRRAAPTTTDDSDPAR